MLRFIGGFLGGAITMTSLILAWSILRYYLEKARLNRSQPLTPEGFDPNL
jgi:hypothetical protein